MALFVPLNLKCLRRLFFYWSKGLKKKKERKVMTHFTDENALGETREVIALLLARKARNEVDFSNSTNAF